tara:strand:+ start:362 stop:1318 length:957 start_codon:yes stop_codon:yes gene_type:complete
MNFKNKINLQMNNNLNRGQTRSYLNTKSVPSKSNLNRSISFDEKRKKNGRRKERLLQQKHAAVDTVCAGVVNKDTIINIFVDGLFSDAGARAILGTTNYQQLLLTNELRTTILPFYADIGADYDRNVSIRMMNNVNNGTGGDDYRAGTASDSLSGITATKNAFALGGYGMEDAPSNVINIMLQASINNVFPDDYEGVSDTNPTDEDDYYTGSIAFMKKGLDVHKDNRAIFFQLGSTANAAGSYFPTAPGGKNRAAFQAFETSLRRTVYEGKTLFYYDIKQGSNIPDDTYPSPGRIYYPDIIRAALRIAGCSEKIDVPA